MTMLVQCPNSACKASCTVADSSSGGQFKCPKCAQPFAVKPTHDGEKGDTKQGQPSSSTNPFPVLPAEFGRYRILKLLGKGGMGAVYLAYDSQLGRQVALKVPFFDAAEAPQRVERFVREARSAAVLHHPNICTVFDAGQIDGRPFITMAYLDGTPLAKEIDAEVPLSQVRVAEIVRKIALALEHAHSKGIVHRDLKPANVMLAAGDEPVVMDFGLAKRVVDVDPNEAKVTRLGGILGTPSYMSPEQVKGDSAAIGPATDVYALGVMLFEMLTGRTPYTGPANHIVMGQILAAPVPPVHEFRPDVDSRLDAICRKALAKNPAERFPNMAAFANVLGFYLKAPIATPPAPPASPVAVVITRPTPPVDPSPFAGLVATSPTAPAATMTRKEPSRPVGQAAPKRWLLAGVALGVALLTLVLAIGFVGLWASGAFKVKTKDGVIVLENLPPDADVSVDGETVTVQSVDGKTFEVRVDASKKKHRIEVKQGGVKVFGDEVEVDAGGRKAVLVRLVPDVILPKPGLDKVPGEKELPKTVDPDRKAAEYVVSNGGTVGVIEQESRKESSISAVADLPRASFRLTWISLRERPVSDAGFASFKDCDLTNLTGLDLYFTQVSDVGLAHFKDCKNLTEIRLAGTKVGDQGLAYFKDCKNLICLDLRQTQVSDVGLASFKDCKNLTELGLDKTQVSNAGLAYFKDCKNLTNLGVGGTQVGDEGVAYFKDCKNLTNLNLGAVQLTNTGVAYFKDCKNLKELWLHGTRVTGACLVHFKDCNNLTFLNLSNTQVTEDLGALKDYTNLKALHLHGTKVGDVGLAQLKDCKNLTFLELIETKVTADGLADFKKALPNCRIDWDGMSQLKEKPADGDATKVPGGKELAKAVTVDLGSGVKMEFVLIPKGKFKMGSPPTEKGRNPWEKAFDAEKLHEVEITKPFYLAKYPVTQEQYEAITGRNPSWFSRTKSDADYRERIQGPMEMVTWDDAQTFCKKMREQDKEKRLFRLPTEAEWEYACRAGTQTAYFFGDEPQRLGDYAWYVDNANGRPHPVGEKKPSAWGLYDMHGNVWQWCEDYYGPYEGLKDQDPLRSAKYSNKGRVMRGGSWFYFGSGTCRAACRTSLGAPDGSSHNVGFRIALSLSDKAALVPSDDPDRRAAEYVLSIDGTVRVNDEERDIKAANDLPKEAFRLTYVLLENTPKVDDGGLVAFKGCKNLTYLHLRSPIVGDAGLTHFKECKQFKMLLLYHTKVTDEGLATFAGCKDLFALCVNDCARVSDAGMIHFKDCKEISKLELSRTKVTDVGLANFKDCKSLDHLRMDTTQVSDDGLAYFKDRPLVGVDLSGCPKVTDAGLAHLNIKNADWLFLAGTNLSDKSVAQFKNCEKVQFISLQLTKVTAAGLAELKKALPNCRIDDWDRTGKK